MFVSVCFVCVSKCASMGGFPLCRLIFITHCKEISARAGGDTTPEDKREQEERVWRDKRRCATKRELEAGADSGAFLSHKMHSPLGIVCVEGSCYIHTGAGKPSDYQAKFFEEGSFRCRNYIKASCVSWLDQS